MPEFVAYCNGQWIPASRLAVPYYDAGFVLGATVTEQLRTFRGEIYCLDEHLERLNRSLEIASINLGSMGRDLPGVAREVARRNFERIERGDDLGIGIFATPGPYATLDDGVSRDPRVAVYPYRLPFSLWAEHYRSGLALVISSVMQIPSQSLPPELKCRSRMHYYLADLEAQRQAPGARPVLIDAHGCVTETPTANVLAYRMDEGVISPPQGEILSGISLMTTRRLAEQNQIPFVERRIGADELAAADEVMLTGTSVCILPVVSCGGQEIGAGVPGPVFHQLLDAWCQHARLDIVAQAERFSRRR